MTRLLLLLTLALPTAVPQAASPQTAQEPPPIPLAPATPELLPVPHPDLEAFEPQVADQIRQYQELTEETLAEPGATAGHKSGAYGELGRVYHAYGLTGAAEVCYVNAIKLAPQQARWHYYLGLLLQQEGRFEEAGRAFGHSLELDPGYPPTYYRIAEVELARGDVDAAEQQLGPFLELEPDDAAGWALKGQIALSRKDYRQTVEHLEKALELLPQANRLHVPLALAYRQLGEEDKARALLARRGAIGARPDDPRIDQLEELKQGERVHLIRGRMAFQAGDLRAAVEEFTQAVEANAESIPARVNLGTALARAGEHPAAIEQFQQALELNPENSTAHYNLGALLLRQGERERARKHLEEALRLNDADASAHLELGGLLAAEGELEAALPHLEQARELMPANVEARLDEATVLVHLGHHAEARERLTSAHRLFPEDGRVARDLALLLAAAPDPELRDGERALDLAQRVFEAQRTVDHAELVALALAELGRCEEAAQIQEQAMEAARRLGAEETLESRLAEALERYRQGPPCRPPLDVESED